MVSVLTTLCGGECVSRNRKNITIQLNKRIDALLRIDEKKVKARGRVDDIHSIKTAEWYGKTANAEQIIACYAN